MIRLHTISQTILSYGEGNNMKSSKTVVLGIVFIACVCLGWFLHNYMVSNRDQIPTEVNIPAEINPRNSPPDVSGKPDISSDPFRINVASQPLSKFQFDFTIKPLTENVLEKTRGLNPSSPQFSPDGKRIVFSAGSEKNHDLWLIDKSGDNLFRLTDTSSDEIDPSWMNDGKRIVYASNVTGTYELWIMNPTGDGKIQVTSDGEYNKTHPRCSPIPWENYSRDIKKEPVILYQGEKDGRSGIWVVGEDGSYPSSVIGPTEQGENYIQPEWSPNSLTCTYTGELNGLTTICQGWDAVDFLNRFHQNFQKIPIERYSLHPVFLPNGTKLAFINTVQDNHALWYAAVDGSDVRKLGLKREILGNVSWSPDGSCFAYTSADNSGLIVQNVYYPLQDVTNLWQYPDYNTKKVDLLEKNRFAVMTTEHNLFPQLYENYSRYVGKYYKIPVFITVDSMLELFHLFYEYTLRSVEKRELLPILQELLNGCISETQSLLKKDSSPIMKEDIAFLIDYFSVARNILAPPLEPTNKTVAQELSLIDKSETVAASPVLKSKIDYS